MKLRLALSFLGALLFASAVAAQPADDGEWRTAGKDPGLNRFSGLAQIHTGNAAQLKLAFHFPTNLDRGHEAAPIVADNTMIVVGPFPNLVYAFDVSKAPFTQKWAFDPKPDSSSQGVACCDVVNRGGAYADGRFFFNTLDNQTIALDAKTGKELWRTKLGEIKLGESMTGAPMVAKGKVFVGNAGGEFGVRGWITALDAATGRIAWRAYSTGPDKDVLIGPNFKPYYQSDQGKDLGIKTWPGEAWRIGGGTVWGFISYDPQLDLIYHGTANPGPWNPEQRPGDNKWTAGLFARRPDTGEAVWYYQTSPHDLHDYDGVNESILADLPIGGGTRKVLMRPDRNGYLYVIDRTSGQVISATPFVHTTTSTGVDLQTGALKYNPAKNPRAGETVRSICPASPGAKDWQPAAWSPRTQLLYIPHQNLCQDAVTSEASYIAGTPFVGLEAKMYPGPGGNRGVFTAWDPVKQRKAWEIQEKFPVWSGALVTAGDVTFYGTMDGWFKAIDARNGKLLWQYKTESGIIGQPVTFRGGDGQQYVAVLAGVGGWSGAIVSAGLDPRDATAALGFVGVMRDLPAATRKGGHLYVFSLQGGAQ
ncbi:methanol/ethanol family PQQ-dependent dehydrogenase [Ramlibacter alkalitolerans]|uniref:Methanol/ethanol family PQQ-dependent dehydrogenase n=1 Tax=Ramlibacter alkalitolerans TaxID=2039631 RepID=A0ABS1JHX6_9BURK|nr:methanol/ethanol family PQQ-dependent dehydrogenase [Ramlibacter alkalitolerans]MBL0423806.1 methanol/ethanol family PQQ-dependent dehydrogenase [Ramlibacter alkalitolerans]